MTTGVVVPASVPMPAEGRFWRALAAVRAATRRGLRFRIRCLLMGHEDSFKRQPRRLMLHCATCGRQTVGWAIGPGTLAVMAAPRTSPQRRTAVVDTAIRVGPWTLRRREGRGEARDRQRQRLVVAASRATERGADDVRRGEPAREGSRLGLLAHEQQPDRWVDVARRVRAGFGG